MAIQLEGNIEALRIYEYLTKVLGTSDLANYFVLIDKPGDARAQKVSLASLLAFSGSQFYDNLFKLISNLDDEELTFVLDNLTANRVLTVQDKDLTIAGLDDIITEILDLSTTELDDTLVLAPDGSGGVEFRAESGGGGAATQVNQGSAYTTLGTLLNESFPGTTLNATNWSGSLPTGASINNKLIIASGSAAWDRFITLTKHYLYEKLTIQVDVTAVTKASGDAWGWSQTNFSAYTSTYVFWKFDQNTGILSAGTNSSANQYGSMQPIEFSVGDNLRFTWKRTPSKTYVTIENLTDSTVPKVQGEWDQFCKWGSGNYYRLTFLGGQQEFTNITIASTVRNYTDNSDGVVIIGDSIGNGYGLQNRIDRFTDILMKGQTHRYENLCVDSWGTAEYTTARLTEFLTNINGKYLLINLGYNDATRGTVLATYQTALENLATTAQGLGFEVIFISPWPHLATDESDYNTYMGNAATAVSAKFIDIWADLTTANLGEKEYYYDGVHPNLWGHAEMARLIDLQDGEVVDLLLGDFENNDILFRGIGFSKELLPLCVIDHQGRVKKADPQKYINKNPIQLQTTLDSNNLPYYQQTGNFGITGVIKHNSAYVQSNNSGLQIGFNNGQTTGGSNINITNRGVSGIGYPQQFSTLSGVRNLLVQGLTTKGSYAHQITGDDNVIIMCQGFANVSGDDNVLIGIPTVIGLTSGSKNVGIGINALKGVTTASNCIHIGTMSNNLSGNASNQIMIGNFVNTDNSANRVNISPGSGIVHWFFGGSQQYAVPDHYFRFAINLSAADDSRGANVYWRTGRGKGDGVSQFIVQCPNYTTASSYQNTFTDMLTIDRDAVKVTQALKIIPITASEAGALTAEEGLIVMVSDTDVTFTSIGLWGYQNGAWAKL